MIRPLPGVKAGGPGRAAARVRLHALTRELRGPGPCRAPGGPVDCVHACRYDRRMHRGLTALVLVAACAGPPGHLDGDGAGPDGIDAGAPDDAGAADDAPPETLEEMCGAEPEALADWEACHLRRTCEARAYCGEFNLFLDAQECIDRVDATEGGRLTYEAFERARSIAAGLASLDVEQFTECLRELSPDRCTTAVMAPSCALRFAGTLADGEPCRSDIECASPGATCQPADCGDSCCEGTCQPRIALGEPCDDFFACEPGLVCSVDRLICVLGDLGSPCESSAECDPGGFCGEEGHCERDRGEGEPCDSLFQCDGTTLCVGLRREVEPARCLRASQPGDTCDWFCRGNHDCALPEQGFGVCTELPTHGEPCSLLRPCVGRGEICGDQGFCVTRGGVGDPCQGGTCMPELLCTDELGAEEPVCRERLADDEAGCLEPSHCASYVCDDGVCRAPEPTCR
jgi:hypothetical protein